ncbi:MAG TPA: MFS transporter [Anaerolineales bacterium]|nr:MFS transporter [Anaerolineales bacterium]
MLKRITGRPLLYLFVSNLIVLFVGMGLFPLLPLYATEFGASKTIVGIYFAIMYMSNAAGSMLPAWLADRLTRKGLFVAGSVLGIPALFLLGRATALWQVVILTSALWLSGGMVIGLAGVFTGLYASRASRGKSFSLMSLPMPLGALIGGAAIGQLVTWRGYASMFSVLGFMWIALPLIGLFVLKDKPVSEPDDTTARLSTSQPQFGGSFYLLLGLSSASLVAINAGRLGTSLSMQALSFSPNAIASSATVSGLVTIPVTFLIGALSDRLGRERFLVTTYLLAFIGALTLVLATQLWQFWLAATSLLVALSASGAISSALATDLLQPTALTRGLSWLKGTGSIAGVISFTGTGLLLDNFGPVPLYLLAMVLPLIAAVGLEAVGCKPKRFLPLPARLHTDFFCM